MEVSCQSDSDNWLEQFSGLDPNSRPNAGQANYQNARWTGQWRLDLNRQISYIEFPTFDLGDYVFKVRSMIFKMFLKALKLQRFSSYNMSKVKCCQYNWGWKFDKKVFLFEIYINKKYIVQTIIPKLIVE